jgi:hypothetical protein
MEAQPQQGWRAVVLAMGVIGPDRQLSCGFLIMGSPV